MTRDPLTSIRIIEGDCREVLKTLADASVDSIVTDPPYELGFMGKAWDGTGIANDPAVWRECLRVLKPGGHLLAFGGTRTQHRMVCAIEDAGFEIRDCIRSLNGDEHYPAWVYGSGFPKSADVSKHIDKAASAVRDVVGTKFGLPGYRTGPTGANAVFGDGLANGDAKCTITAASTEAAKQWQGWGTALKPAWEPICVARKPIEGTVAANVLAYGTGALNIDGCRVPSGTDYTDLTVTQGGQRSTGGIMNATGGARGTVFEPAVGRWPANLLHDGSPEVVALFPQTGPSTGGKGAASGLIDNASIYGKFSGANKGASAGGFGDTGSAARFFYCAKASAADRGSDNHHPTVKPTALMRYLVRLVTPPGGTVLDPFMGSGSTLKAAELEGFGAIGIETDPGYIAIARQRIGSDAPLFAEVIA